MSESIQKKCLEKILNSPEFANSKIDQTYLSYLVDAYHQGKSLKEMTIAIDVFGKDSKFNPADDTIVRSHTYSLRKKLERYYFEEGKKDRYRLKIPKGHYEARFVQVNDSYLNPKNLLSVVSKHSLLLIILILLFGVLYFYTKHRSSCAQLQSYQLVAKDDPFWHDYLQSQLPVMIVVGDHFFFNDYSEKYKEIIAIRHPRVNSKDDLEYYQLQNPNDNIAPSKEPYFPYHSIWSLPPVLSMLYSVNKTPILRKSSDVSPQILNEYNLIFLGSIKTLYALKHTLSKSHFEYSIAPHRITYKHDENSEPKVFETTLHSHGPNEDLVLAIKMPGPVNNSIFIICSYHSLGAPEIANYLLSVDRRQELENKFVNTFGKVPDYFEVLFRVTGIDRTAYNTEILVYDEIQKETEELTNGKSN